MAGEHVTPPSASDATHGSATASERTEIRGAAAPVSARCGRAPIQSRVVSMPVVIPFEIAELRLQISGRPEQRAVQTFAPDGPNQPFYERMRERDIRHGL